MNLSQALDALNRSKRLAAIALAPLFPFAAASCLLASCASGPGYSESRLPAARSANLAEQAMMTRGRELYARNCAKCHELFDPLEFTQDEWPRHVKRYGPRAGLNASRRAEVLTYLTAVASRNP